MLSTACHYQCQNTNTCHTHLKQESITNLHGLLLFCILWWASQFYTARGTQTSSTYTAFTAHRLPQQTLTSPLLHTSFLNIHTTFTAHRLSRHTHHHALSLLKSTTVCAAWAPNHHQGNPGLKVTFDLKDYYPCHPSLFSPCHCYNIHTCVVTLPLL